jgi:molybdopterin/thiamine biosynthesis adenylyltransferase
VIDISKKVLVVGIGGLGSIAAFDLAQCGIKTIGLMDPDNVELSNLHRQLLYTKDDIGYPKVIRAQKRLKNLFPSNNYIPYEMPMEESTFKNIAQNYDLIVDGLDRIEKKFTLNDMCVKLNIPYIHAGAVQLEGQVLPVFPGLSACLRCLFDAPTENYSAPSCQEIGVLGPAVQTIGWFQVFEIRKFLNQEKNFFLWKINLENRKIQASHLLKSSNCKICN